jgi:hypothetical protein
VDADRGRAGGGGRRGELAAEAGHALIKNLDRASRASNGSEVTKSTDGSVEIYFGPKALAGKASNWVPTDPARRFELMFRLYGPTKALVDKAWRLPDVEKVK